MLRLSRWRLPFGGRKVGGYCVLRFPDSTETRWFDQIPTPGARIESYWGRVWVVDEVLQSGRDTYTVFCVDRREYRDKVRQRSGSELADELLELTRDAVAAGRRRWKNRNYLP